MIKKMRNLQEHYKENIKKIISYEEQFCDEITNLKELVLELQAKNSRVVEEKYSVEEMNTVLKAKLVITKTLKSKYSKEDISSLVQEQDYINSITINIFKQIITEQHHTIEYINTKIDTTYKNIKSKNCKIFILQDEIQDLESNYNDKIINLKLYIENYITQESYKDELEKLQDENVVMKIKQNEMTNEISSIIRAKEIK